MRDVSSPVIVQASALRGSNDLHSLARYRNHAEFSWEQLAIMHDYVLATRRMTILYAASRQPCSELLPVLPAQSDSLLVNCSTCQNRPLDLSASPSSQWQM